MTDGNRRSLETAQRVPAQPDVGSITPIACWAARQAAPNPPVPLSKPQQFSFKGCHLTPPTVQALSKTNRLARPAPHHVGSGPSRQQFGGPAAANLETRAGLPASCFATNPMIAKTCETFSTNGTGVATKGATLQLTANRALNVQFNLTDAKMASGGSGVGGNLGSSDAIFQ